MPTNTYTPLGTITLSASASEVIFSGIPASLNGQSFRDLVLVINGELSTTATPDLTLRVNGDASNYSQVYMRGNGSATASGTYSVIYLNSASTWSSGRQYNHIVQLMDYTATDKHKTILARGNWAGGDVNATASRWASTAAITSISVSVNTSSMATGATFSIYGIAG